VEYASTVWDPYTQKDIHTLEMVQRRGARYVCNRQGNRSSVDSMLDTLKWKSLQHRRRDARLHMLYKTYHEDVAISKEGRLIPPETCIHYLSKYHTAAATIESIPYSHELSEIGIRYLQTQQPPQHLLLSKHKLANFHIRKCF
jgi:hypothetical protein